MPAHRKMDNAVFYLSLTAILLAAVVSAMALRNVRGEMAAKPVISHGSAFSSATPVAVAGRT